MRANLNGFLSQRLAAHPPLRLEYRFNDIAGFAGGSIRSVSTLRVFYVPADRDLHRIVFCLDVQPSIFQGFDHSHPGVEPFHTLSKRWSPTVRDDQIATDLELLASIFIQRSIIVQDIDEL
jgi:hypothetical protein